MVGNGISSVTEAIFRPDARAYGLIAGAARCWTVLAGLTIVTDAKTRSLSATVRFRGGATADQFRMADVSDGGKVFIRHMSAGKGK